MGGVGKNTQFKAWVFGFDDFDAFDPVTICGYKFEKTQDTERKLGRVRNLNFSQSCYIASNSS
ncbi:hypothetical protein Hanom_Chr04g00293501 [Helianthus anomalus]